MIRAASPVLLVALLLWCAAVSPARADEVEPSRHPTGAATPAHEDDPCEGNRRCRLQRFRLQQTARRAAQIEREIRAEEERRKARARILEATLPVRQVRKFELDGVLNANPAFGRGFRVAFGNALFRGEAQLAWMDLNGYSNSISSNSRGLAWTWRGRWTLTKEQGSLYLAAGASLFDLDVSSWGSFDPDFGWTTSSDQKGRVHAATVAVGFDFLARMGFHAGLEVQYLLPFYLRVRDTETGAYDDGAARALRNGLDGAFGVSVMGGWGF